MADVMLNQICSQCGAAHRRNGRYCSACRARGISDDQRRRGIARATTNQYLQRGVLQKLPCEKCGAAETEKHHPDYQKPKEIIWLCRSCHMEWHALFSRVTRETLARWLGVKMIEQVTSKAVTNRDGKCLDCEVAIPRPRHGRLPLYCNSCRGERSRLQNRRAVARYRAKGRAA